MIGMAVEPHNVFVAVVKDIEVIALAVDFDQVGFKKAKGNRTARSVEGAVAARGHALRQKPEVQTSGIWAPPTVFSPPSGTTRRASTGTPVETGKRSGCRKRKPASTFPK